MLAEGPYPHLAELSVELCVQGPLFVRIEPAGEPACDTQTMTQLIGVLRADVVPALRKVSVASGCRFRNQHLARMDSIDAGLIARLLCALRAIAVDDLRLTFDGDGLQLLTAFCGGWGWLRRPGCHSK